MSTNGWSGGGGNVCHNGKSRMALPGLGFSIGARWAVLGIFNIEGKFGGGFNLAIWRCRKKSPN